jgi:hypothetical protein
MAQGCGGLRWPLLPGFGWVQAQGSEGLRRPPLPP